MQIDYIQDLTGDWVAVYVDGEIFYQDHSIDDWKWLELVKKASFQSVEIREWEFDIQYWGASWYPVQLTDIIEKLTPIR